MVGLVVGLGSYGEYVITLGGELLRERPEFLFILYSPVVLEWIGPANYNRP